MPELLTDDEIVAIAGATGEWFAPLPTVALSDFAEAEPAAERGARSLAVRELLSASDRDGAPLFAGESCALVQQIIRSPRTAVAYIAERDAPHRLAGGVTVLAVDDDARAVLDLVSTAGIHDLTAASAAEAEFAFFHFVRGAFELGVDAPPAPDGLFSPTTPPADAAREAHGSRMPAPTHCLIVELRRGSSTSVARIERLSLTEGALGPAGISFDASLPRASFADWPARDAWATPAAP